MTDTITILLATYNGEKYIRQQLDSLFKQTYTNWRLLIRDDGSTDSTQAIIQSYQQQHTNKITIIEKTGTGNGSLANFSALLQAASGAGYIMFCDQDDKWKPDKIELTFSKMKELEAKFGNDHPVLIFTNFQYVDEEMNIIESKKDFEINRIANFGFPQLLAQNPVYGCTTMMNKALSEKVSSIPPEADYHDHWIALIAAAFGTLCYLKNRTVLYRQHGNNVSGNFDNDSFTKRVQRIIVNQKNIQEAQRKYIMLLHFQKKYGNMLNVQNKVALQTFLCLYTNKKLSCLLKSVKYKIRSQTLPQSVLLYFSVLFSKVSS